MDYFIFVVNISDSSANKKDFSSYLQRLQDTCDGIPPLKSYLGKVVLTSSNLKTAEVVHEDWTAVSEINVETLWNRLNVGKPGAEEDDSNRSSESTCLGRALLEVSESLPYAGVCVRVILFNLSLGRSTENEDCDPHLPFYGALKKLSSWHNAEITYVSGQPADSDSVQTLRDFTGASVTSDVSQLSTQQPLCVWRGKMSVLNKMENEGHVFPGFELCCENEDDALALSNRTTKLFIKSSKAGDTAVPVYGRMLEVLDQVDSRTVPPFMLTHHSLQLSMWKHHPFSEMLHQELSADNQTAVVARLAVYCSDTVNDCSQKLSAQAWRDSLMTNVDYVQEREEDLGTGVRFLNLLLIGDEVEGHIKAIVLHDASEINSNLFSLESTMCSGNHGNGAGSTMEEYLQKLGHVSGKVLQEFNTSLADIQTEMLKDWIADCEKRGQPTTMAADILWRMLGNIQAEFLNRLVTDGVWSGCDGQDNSDPLPVVESDLTTDPLQWAERQALHHHDNQKREMRRFQSSESMCLSSPLHPDEGNTSIDVKDFLKLFKPDGNASKDTLSPIRQQSKRKLTKLSSQGDITLQWPDCRDTHYHGIDYYKHLSSEKKEKHFSQLREKYLKEETCSSFTTKTILKKKPAASTNHRRQRSGGHSILSPNRRSPRSLRGSHCNRKEEEDLRPSISQPSRQKLLMQHPGLKSPRKRQSLPSQQLRRSPRKQPSAGFQRLRSDGDITLPPPPKRKRRSDPEGLDESLEEKSTFTQSESSSDAAKKPSRSERHKKKLEEICRSVLVKHGVDESDVIFKSCSDKLFQVTKFFVKALPNSRNLSQEMKNIAEGQVTQVVDLEKRRQEMKRTSRK